MSVKRRKRKKKLKLFPIIVLIAIIFGIILLFKGINKIAVKDAYVKGNTPSIELYIKNKASKIEKVDDVIYRGSIVKKYGKEIKENKITYVKIKYNDKEYFINKDNLTMDKDKIIAEKELYVRTSTTLYKASKSVDILGLVKKGEKVDIISYDEVSNKGVVNKYKVKYNDKEGYIYGKYLVATSEESLKVYDKDNLQEYLSNMGNTLGGGTATDLDY